MRRKHGGRYKTNFISLKPVLAFQTLTLATLGKWATTHERVFFLGKNCSWTLLPGSIWLRMPITRLRYISCISFLFNGILFDAQSIHVLCSRHNNRCKQSVPRFLLYILFSFDFKTAKIQWNTLWTVCLFAVQQNNKVSFVFVQQKISKRCRLENWAFCKRYFSRMKSAPAQKNSEQCFSGTTKPTCQNSAIFEHFQNGQKI